MAIIYTEDWSSGNSLFNTVYTYERYNEGVDPLYPNLYRTEGVYVNGDGRLDANPAWVGPFQEYSTAGIWVKGMGALTRDGDPGFWDGTVGCIQCLYYPTTESLGENGGANGCPLLAVTTPAGFQILYVYADLYDQEIEVGHRNEGSHPFTVDLIGAPMPVAGEAYLVRIGWQCGTFDPVLEVTAADGFVRVWINDELAYEATDISLYLSYPDVPLVGAPNLIDSVEFGFAGLLGPLDNFTIRDSACAPISPLVFKSGVTERPLIWMEHTLRGA